MEYINARSNNRSSFELLLFTISILSILFLGSNLGVSLGFGESLTTIQYAAFMSLLVLKHVKGEMINSYTNPIKLMLLLGIFTFFVKVSIGQQFTKDILVFFIFPFLLAATLENMTSREQSILRYLVVFLFVTEVGLAIYERVTGTIIFASEDEYKFLNALEDDWSFRASALFGHPLMNAMVVMIIILFILTSQFTFVTKIVFFFIAVLGQFCFNERGNIIVTVICSLPLLYLDYKRASKPQQKRGKWLLTLGVSVLLYFLFNSNLGGRLTMDTNSFSKDDSSMSARFEAFESFFHLNSYEILYGGENLYEKLLVVMHLAGIENGIISLILKFGLLLGIPTLICLLYFQAVKLRNYPKLNAIIILFAFYVVGFTNPHIAGYRPWLIFIVSCYAFTPINKNNHNATYRK